MNGSDHVPGVIGRQRLAELSQDSPEPLVSSASTAGLGGWNAGLKSSDCPFRPPPVIAPSSPQSPRTPILPMGPRPDQTFRDGCCSFALCLTCLWSRTFPHKMNSASICSSLLCKSPPGRECLCVSSSAPSLDRRFYPRKEHETTSRFLLSNL